MIHNVRNSVLNWKNQKVENIANSLYPTNGDALDKRSFGKGTTAQQLTATVDAINDVSEMFSNALGKRSPYLTIGEIAKEDWLGGYSDYLGSAGGAVRAIQNLVSGVDQEGVIIDCLGDVSGETSVEFTNNPMMFITNAVVDTRIRQPAKVTATIGISNYLSDDILGDMVNTLTNAIGGIGNGLINQLVNGGSTRAQAALYRLRWLMENGKPFTVHTPHGIYENMLIKSIKAKTDENTMDMLYADIEFQEVILYTYYRESVDELKKSSTPKRTAISSKKASSLSIRSFL